MEAGKLKYLDPSQPIEERINDLLSRMTLEDKFRQMGMHTTRFVCENGKFSKKLADEFFKGIGIGVMEDPRLEPEDTATLINEVQKYLIENTRLGIPALISSECLHGFVNPGATMFPQAITMGSSWNPELVREVAAAIAKEASSCGSKQALAPDLDLARELRWGRVEETYGEDPYLCSVLGAEYIKGLQGERAEKKKDNTGTTDSIAAAGEAILAEDKIIATIKHFAAHGSPEGGLNLSLVATGERQLRELYLKPFKKAVVEAGALSVMPAYSEMDGIPCSASKFLLIDILRNEWGFEGYTYSDYGAVDMLHSFQKTAETLGMAGKQALEAGMDLEAPSICGFGDELMEMVRAGKADEKLVDLAVSRILRAKFLSGIFERPYVDVSKVKATVNCKSHKELSLKAAQESIVLLKNKDNILPLDKKIKSIAVIGPNAAVSQLGDFGINKDDAVTLLEGIKNKVDNDTRVFYAKGCELYGSSKEGFKEALDVAKKCDVAVAAVGTASAVQWGVGWGVDMGEIATCGEGSDLTDISLSGVQEELVKEIWATGTPTIMVLINGRPLAIETLAEKIPAILEAWYPGEEGGNAIADIIFGNVNPSGRLPISFPKVSGQLPIFYNHKPSARGYYNKPGTPDKPGRDYVFNDTKPLYEFGYGLSYTQFEYTGLRVYPETINAGDEVFVNVKVKNTGSRAGMETVQLYMNDVYSSVTTPVKELKGFKKVNLKPGEEREVNFILTAVDMSLIELNMKEVVEPGLFEVMVGGLKAEYRVKYLD